MILETRGANHGDEAIASEVIQEDASQEEDDGAKGCAYSVDGNPGTSAGRKESERLVGQFHPVVQNLIIRLLAASQHTAGRLHSLSAGIFCKKIPVV